VNVGWRSLRLKRQGSASRGRLSRLTDPYLSLFSFLSSSFCRSSSLKSPNFSEEPEFARSNRCSGRFNLRTRAFVPATRQSSLFCSGPEYSVILSSASVRLKEQSPCQNLDHGSYWYATYNLQTTCEINGLARGPATILRLCKSYKNRNIRVFFCNSVLQQRGRNASDLVN
jgi:hypothetical protein